MSSDDSDSEATLTSPYDATSSDEMSEECDCDSCRRSSSLSSSSDGWPASLLPGCSKGQGHSKPWTMSTTMMQTYLTMKGQGAGAKDPLVKFFSMQEDGRLKKGAAVGMVSDMKKAIREDFTCNMQGPATFGEDERQSLFQYKRAKVDHFHLDNSLDRDLLEIIYENHDNENDGWREVASDISDDEGGPKDGRISPCTFACWAEGSKRWDDPANKDISVVEDRKEYEIPDVRQRPPSPNTHKPRVLKRRNRKQLSDGDGGALSPICSEYATTEPSLLWSPPPMCAKLPDDYYNRNLERMDPKLVKALRKGAETPVASFGFCATCDTPESEVSLEFSKTEQDEVVGKYWDLDETNKEFEERESELHHLIKNAETVHASNERFRHDITRLKHENRKLGECFDFKGTVRHRRILQKVDKRLRELKYAAKAKMAEIQDQYTENWGLRKEYSYMQKVHDGYLKYFDKETAEDVFAMFPHVWKPLEYRKNRRNLSA